MIEIELERTEPKNRFNAESNMFDPILDMVMNDFPDIKNSYLQEYNSYIEQTKKGDHSGPTYSAEFIEQIYNPILLTTKAINEINKVRKPQEPYPQLYDHNSIRLIVRAIHYNPDGQIDTTLQLVQKAMQCMELTEAEFYRCKVYNICMLQIQKMENEPTQMYKHVIPQMRENARQVLDSLRPPRVIKEKTD